MKEEMKVGGEEVEVVAWQHLQGNYSEVAERPLLDDEKSRGWIECELMTVAQHHRITEALRGEVERLTAAFNDPDYPPKYSRRLIAELRDELGKWKKSHEETYAPALHDAHAMIAELRAQLAQQQVPDELRELLVEMVDIHRRRGVVLTIHVEQIAELLAAPAPVQADQPTTQEEKDAAALRYLDRANAPVQAEPASPWVPVKERYTCIGKGGSYELIGRADCAGTLRHTGRFTDEVIVYRDAESGSLYCRSPGDFMTRMERLPAALPPAPENDK